MGQKTHLQKKQHQNNKGWAEGGRETILERHVSEYVVEFEKGPVTEQECTSKIVKEFLFYTYWFWPDSMEPAQPFALYNSNATPPNKDLMEEEQIKKHEHIKYITKVSKLY